MNRIRIISVVRLTQWLNTIATSCMFGLSIKLIRFFDHPGIDAGPGNPPDVHSSLENMLAAVGGAILLFWSLLFIPFAIACWRREKTGFLGFALIAGTQGFLHLGAIVFSGARHPALPSFVLPVLTLGVMILNLIACSKVSLTWRGHGFPVIISPKTSDEPMNYPK